MSEMAEQSLEQEFPDGLVEIHDPEIDTDAIMGEIRERIARRRAELGYEKRIFPAFGAAAYPGEPEDVDYDADLYHHLRLVNESYTRLETAPVLVASPATRLPLLGKLWSLIRSSAHDLILFYVNRAVNHQTNTNRHLISVLNRLAAVNAEQQRTIKALQAEVAALRRKLED